MKALIAMSGGVDSSVAAYMMKQQDFTCIGCTMKLFDAQKERSEKSCCSLDDTEDARSVAMSLGIPYYVFNYKDEFRAQVMDRFAQSYICGKTPNPCIDCNRYLKFGALMQRAEELGCDFIVTGHYARIDQKDGNYRLLRAKDDTKDQSYVLWNLTQQQLAHVRFPLGELTKDEVRAVADSLGFVNSKKPDSQDICFVPDGNYAGFIEEYTGNAAQPGDFTDSSGNVLGQHKGIIHYTVGQRKGLGIAFGEPRYVLATDPRTRRVVLGTNEELFKTTVYATDVNWISGRIPSGPVSCSAKLRYRQQPAEAVAYPENIDESPAVRLEFKEPQRAVTPGQSAVFYLGDEVLGGGIIC